EVIVVDDGSDDGSPEEAELDAQNGRPVRVISGPGTGSMVARTEGARLARADYVAFTDSDCEPEPGWLEAGVAALDAGNDVVGGLTVPARAARPLERTTIAGAEGLYPTCNVFFRRTALLGAGGFGQPAARRLGFRPHSAGGRLGTGEDTLLAWTVGRAGRAAFAPGAVVRHHVFPPAMAETFSRAWLARVFPPLVRAVPELRDGPLFRWRVQVGGRTRAPLYALVVLGLAGRRVPAAVAAAWWVGARAAGLRRCAGSRTVKARALPVELAVDVVTSAALVTASVQARSLVL
ncbi:MAG: glycosyl transferase family 2, partial [Acidimicrobiales bacterium]|nr:glycosyl transferase family 2 [Acidimicrobiales bacterium]